jgi:cytochrome c oxidase subunit 2
MKTIAAVMLAMALGTPQVPSPAPQTPKVIRVSAERFAFTPSEITVEKGTTIEFHLTSDDTDHGFRIIGTDVDAQIPKRRRGETVVKYTADTAGRFIIECSRPCGAGHTAMRATLIVK